MKIAAVICEYNPFHNGHAYHIEETRKQTGCDYVVGIMSGNFVQRGEPAILDKWARTRMALSCGIDAVFELPCIYALSSAQYFALGGVTLADGLGVDFLSFGAESSLEDICTMAQTKCRPEYEQRLRKAVEQGMTYPKAATVAFGDDFTKITPNDLLAIEYVVALTQLQSKVNPCVVRRAYVQHDEFTSSEQGFASAKQIRQLLNDIASCENATTYMPARAAIILEEWIRGETIVRTHHFDQLIMGLIRRMGSTALNQMPFAGGGLGDLIYKNASSVTTIEELVTRCTSSRYTSSRIRRFLLQVMLGIDRFLCKEPAPYGRLLGFRKDSSRLIGDLEKRSRIPIIKSVAKTRDEIAQFDVVFNYDFDLDLRAQDLYSLVMQQPEHKCGMRDYTTPMVILD